MKRETPPTSALAAFTRYDILVCATRGKVYGLNKYTGDRLWRAVLPGASFREIVSLFINADDNVIAGCKGTATCLDLFTGNVIWKNEMRWCGFSEVGALCIPGDSSKQLAHHNDKSVLPKKSIAILTCKGKCLAVDAKSGQEIWRFEFPFVGSQLAAVIYDLREGNDNTMLYIGYGTAVYCLNAHTGNVNWGGDITSGFIHFGVMTLATPWSSQLAEVHSSFNQFPSAQQEISHKVTYG
ncbi:hypothetical protein BDC45DRAFT_607166 [Circinella umbellata]|nr:hypothetical protein BDC45DRAFT_607166 [Circinella umbellata]